MPDESLLRRIGRGSRTLWERLATAPDIVLPPPLESRLLASWARVVAAGSEPALRRRLGWDGIQPRYAAAALMPEGEDDGEAPAPGWTADLRAYAARAARRPWETSPADATGGIPFVELWEPWAKQGLEWLREESGPDLDELAPSALKDLRTALLAELAAVSEAAAYELFDARRQAVEGAGEELYQGFVADCLSDPLGLLYGEFPVLARQTVRLVRQWVERHAELVGRLRADRSELGSAFFQGRDPGPVRALESGLSDRHRDGRQVAVLVFQEGSRLVYKPRSLAAEEAFAGLLTWCSRRGLDSVPPGARVLCREGYGWMEWVEPAALPGRDAARAYYRSAGVLVALACVLRAEDLHAENVIATAAGPTVIDAENLLQPLRAVFVTGEEPEGESTAPASCLVTGLLTQLLPGGREDRGMGGLRVAERRLARRVWSGLGRDPRFEVAEEKSAPLPNTPRLAGEPLGPEEFATEISEGFAAAYDFLTAQREAIMAKDGPLERFREIAVRVLFRPSQDYGRVHQLSALPRNQRSGLTGSWLQEALLGGLVASEADGGPGDGEEPPLFWPLAREERTALTAGDVPWFGLSAESTELRCQEGDTVRGLFAMSGLAAVRQRLSGLDARDRDRQRELIRLALTPSFPNGPLALAASSGAGEGSEVQERFALAAQALGEEIAQEVETGGLDGPPDLAGGPLGIALFVAALVRREGGRRFEACLEQLMEAAAAEVPAGRLPVGGFSGLGSVLWGRVWLGRLTHEPRLLEGAESLARHLQEPYGRDSDLERGAAGAVLGLLCLAQATGGAAHVEAARRWGERLLADQRISGSAGAGWPNPRNLIQTGWMHGTAGVARALSALAEATGDPRFFVAAVAAIGHERQLFDPRRRNWPVLLIDETGRRRWRRWMVACCRGAPGAALARLYLSPSLQDVTLEAEREVALETTADAPLSEIDHLCCGNFGRSSILLTAARRAGAERWREAAERLAAAALDRSAPTGRLILAEGYDNLTRRPGFLRGTAGVGYQLLRLAGADLPDILALELPGERGREP